MHSSLKYCEKFVVPACRPPECLNTRNGSSLLETCALACYLNTDTDGCFSVMKAMVLVMENTLRMDVCISVLQKEGLESIFGGR